MTERKIFAAVPVAEDETEECRMKVVLPIDENKDTVCVAFGRAPFFAVCNTENGHLEYHTNPAASAHGGAGIKAAQFVVDLGADALVTVRLGENSAQLLKEADIKIYKSSVLGLTANVEAYKRGELAELTQFHAGFHSKP